MTFDDIAIDHGRRGCSVRAHAKLSVTLDVLGRRADGYHEVIHVIQLLELHDVIALTTSQAPSKGQSSPRLVGGFVGIGMTRAGDRSLRAPQRRTDPPLPADRGRKSFAGCKTLRIVPIGGPTRAMPHAYSAGASKASMTRAPSTLSS